LSDESSLLATSSLLKIFEVVVALHVKVAIPVQIMKNVANGVYCSSKM